MKKIKLKLNGRIERPKQELKEGENSTINNNLSNNNTIEIDSLPKVLTAENLKKLEKTSLVLDLSNGLKSTKNNLPIDCDILIIDKNGNVIDDGIEKTDQEKEKERLAVDMKGRKHFTVKLHKTL